MKAMGKQERSTKSTESSKTSLFHTVLIFLLLFSYVTSESGLEFHAYSDVSNNLNTEVSFLISYTTPRKWFILKRQCLIEMW